MKRKYIFLIIEQRYLIDKCLFKLYVTCTNKNANFSLSEEIYPIYSLISLLSIKKNIVSCVERKRKTETNLHSCNDGIISKRSKTYDEPFVSIDTCIYNEQFFSRYFTRNNWKEKKKKKQNSSLLTAKSSQLSLEF